ncbi:MAG TPA: MBL fold metallo-hydrolase [Gemmatimonadaceae bacterium]
MRKIALLLALPAALAAQNFDTIQIKSQQLRGGVYVLTGSGGNIGLSIGDDMAFVIDDQYAPLSSKILAHIATLTNKPVKFVVNTHWHGDHTGGNENMGKAGAILIAHDNVRKRMSTEQFNALFNNRTPASPAGALPIITFSDSTSFYVNGETVVAFHVAPAHTDGDVVIHFTNADVIHMGDTFFTSGYPFVDLSSGGSVIGYIGAADRVLAMCGPNTIVIPGHGAVSNCGGLREWRNMIVTIRDRVQAAMKKGNTLAQIKATGVSKEFDDRWGKGFIKPDVFAEMVYRSLGGK